MAGFSGAIKLAEMNDYLSLNQSCIKPLMKKGGESGEKDAEPKEKANTGTRMTVAFEFSASDARDLRFPGLQSSGGAFGSLAPTVGLGSSSSASAAPGHFDQMKLDPVKKTASVSLNDCLACSGCVTSAETVLITQQSTQELLNVLEGTAAAVTDGADGAASSMSDVGDAPAPAVKRSVIMSISPQSLTALAHEFKLAPIVCAKKLTTFFVRVLGCLALVDTTPALDIALIEAQEEFVARYRWNQAQLDGKAPPAAASSAALAPAASSSFTHANTTSPSHASPLPILSSECPGWICYCEKTQGADTLAHVSSVRSGQAIMGALLKQWWCPSRGLSSDSVFHASIMPCFDKKLEGSRDDFFIEQFATRETDCVLTTGEVVELIKQKGIDLASLEDSPLNADFFNVTPDQSALYRSLDVGGSGGYCDSLFRFAARRLFGVTYAESDALPYAVGRNPDFRELTLVHHGKTVLSFALAYGFRNIQNLVRKMKTKRPGKVVLPENAVSLADSAAPVEAVAVDSPSGGNVTLPVGSGGYHFVEVMACPSGCLNGGGQVKAADIRSQKQLVVDLDTLYHERAVCRPEDNPIVKRIYAEWLQTTTPYTGLARQHLHTQYHSVEKDTANPLGIKW